MSYISRGNFTTGVVLTIIGLFTAGTLLIYGIGTFYGAVSAPSYTATSTTGGGYRFATAGNIDIGTSALPGGRLNMVNVSSTAIDATRYVSTTKAIIGLGSLSLPTLTFQGDPDTGIYWTQANNIGISGGGSLKMQIGAGGIINYATVAPSSDNGISLGTSGLRWSQTNTVQLNAVNASTTRIDAIGYVSTTNLYLGGTSITGLYHKQGGNAYNTTSTIGTTDAKGLSLLTGGSARLTITPAGLVGVNTTNPTVQFHVRGSYPFMLFEDISSPSFMSVRGDANWFFDTNSTLTFASQANANKGTATGETNRFKIKGATGNIYASGTMMTGGLVTYGNANPGTNNLYDLGTSSLYWRKLYATNVSSTNIDAVGYVSSAKLYAGVGSASAPSMSFGDPDSGIYSGGADAISIGTGGGIKLLIQSPIYTYTSFVPGSNNAHTLGTFQYNFSNVHASGTAYLKNISSTNVTSSKMGASALPAAAAGLQPVCVDATGMFGYGAAGICPVSSIKLKNILGKSSYGLKEILRTNFYDYTFKDGRENGRVNIGPVAEYMTKTMPNLVLRDGKGSVIGYDTNSMIAVLGQAIKDMQVEIDGLKQKCK